LNRQIAAKKQQMLTVNKAIAAAIKRAIKEANEEKRRRELAEANAAKAAAPKGTKPKRPEKAPATKPESVLLASEADVTLNTNFERNRGNLPWPVGSGYLLLHYGNNTLGNGVEVVSQGISIGCEIGTSVKAVFDGEVLLVNNYDDVQMVVIKHGRYFTGYSNISGVSVSKGQRVKVGQVIGRAAANLDGVGAMDFQISNEKSEMNPEAWLKRR
jgi:septal ring factor EnvC (AmiA/AmiB activator)